MTTSFKKLLACPRNIADTKVLLVGAVCSMVIFTFFTVVEDTIGLTVFEAIIQSR